MIAQINHMYEQQVKDNEELKSWVDKLADFILREHYQMTFVNEEQWNFRKAEVVKNIIEGEQYE